MEDRKSSIARTTSETDITLALNLDGAGAATVDTGIGFFDHMLKSFAKHGFFDMSLVAKGDLYVDSHHTIEDTGIVLGKAIKEAVGDKKGIPCPWMTHSSFVPWICPDVRTCPMTWS